MSKPSKIGKYPCIVKMKIFDSCHLITAYIDDIAREFHEPVANDKTLFLDLEIANYKSKQDQKISLIQVLSRRSKSFGDVVILDVLDEADCISHFIQTIMVDPLIVKVFHNKSFDIRYLGGNLCQNVHCTLQMARQLPYFMLPVPNYKLDTITHHLLDKDVSMNETEKQNLRYKDKKEIQSSEWNDRPLSDEQLR